MGFGVGGLLTSDATQFFGTQEELVTVTAIEDFVKIDSSNYLKEVDPQVDGSPGIPTNFSIRYIVDILESEVTFAGNTSKSDVVVGTSVKISEAGLYISGADPTLDPDQTQNSTRLVAYNIFDPIPLNPDINVSAEWEFRF
jgi:hypothetical protein